MINKLIIWIQFVIIISVSAAYLPKWERPIFEDVDMEIEEAENIFNHIEQAGLSLNQRDGYHEPTSLTLKLFDDDGNIESLTLPITNYEVTRCGAFIYNSNMKTNSGNKYSIRLIDYKNTKCKDDQNKKWEVFVLSNFKYFIDEYGTMVKEESSNQVRDTLKLTGSPKPVYSILSTPTL